MIDTTQAAYLLGICPQRVRQLLKEGRIQGAEKVGRFWRIPLYNGMPKIVPGSRGPQGSWRKQPSKSLTHIYLNEEVLQKNQQNHTTDPVITVKRGNRDINCHYVEISGPSRLVYRPESPKNGGATLWIEVEPNVEVVTKVFGQY